MVLPYIRLYPTDRLIKSRISTHALPQENASPKHISGLKPASLQKLLACNFTLGESESCRKVHRGYADMTSTKVGEESCQVK